MLRICLIDCNGFHLEAIVLLLLLLPFPFRARARGTLADRRRSGRIVTTMYHCAHAVCIRKSVHMQRMPE